MRLYHVSQINPKKISSIYFVNIRFLNYKWQQIYWTIIVICPHFLQQQTPRRYKEQCTYCQIVPEQLHDKCAVFVGILL